MGKIAICELNISLICLREINILRVISKHFPHCTVNKAKYRGLKCPSSVYTEGENAEICLKYLNPLSILWV